MAGMDEPQKDKAQRSIESRLWTALLTAIVSGTIVFAAVAIVIQTIGCMAGDDDFKTVRGLCGSLPFWEIIGVLVVAVFFCKLFFWVK